MKPEPFRIEPAFLPRIWGARSLAPLYPEKTNLTEPIGEVWLTGVNCKVATGPFAGKTLGEAWRDMPSEWRGALLAKTRDFPILVKFIFPTEKLSIQVHPNDTFAAAHEQAAGGRGKTEMWHIVSAERGASLLLGLKPGVTRESFVEAIENCTLEDLFLRHTVEPGDTYFVPAGTPHTIGPHMVVCEVQEYSDLTYRVYDYGRVDAGGKPRQLHIEKALAVTNFRGMEGGKVAPRELPRSSWKRNRLCECPYFAAERWEVADEIAVRPYVPGFYIYVFLCGSGELEWDTSQAHYRAGECWLVPRPPDVHRVIPTTTTSLICAYVPVLAASSQNLNVQVPR